MFIKLLALGIVGAFLGIILKRYSKELVVLLEIAVVLAGLFIVRESLLEEFASFGKVFSSFGEGAEMFKAVFKASAVTVISKLGSELCKESGNGLMGDIVELGGRVMLIILALPFIERVTEIALAFVK